METKRPSLDWYVQHIKAGPPFAFSRWGDGEFFAVLGQPGRNCDGHEYFPALGADLRRALQNQYPYTFAIGPQATRQMGTAIERYLSERKIAIDWHATDVFVTALIENRLQPLVDVLRNRAVHYVGPEHLFNNCKPGTVAGVFPWASISVIPEKNCYLSKDRIRDWILDTVTHHPADVIGFSAGMVSNVLIDELWPEIGSQVVMIDFGSLWDGYAGRISRSYHKRVNYGERVKVG